MVLTIDTPVDFAYDPYSEEALRDPTDLYRVLRQRYPAYPLPQYDAWALSRFDDVWQVGEDGERFVMDIGPVYNPADLARRNAGAPARKPLDPMPSFSMTDPPVQTALRQGLVAPLRPHAIGLLEEKVRALARQRLDELVPKGEFDLYTDYGGVVSAGVMATVMGLPIELAPRILELVNQALRRKPPGAVEDAVTGRAGLELHMMLVDVVAHRRLQGPTGDGYAAIDGMLSTELDGRALTDDEIAVQLFTVLSGGTETVPKVVARCLLELSRRPDQLAAVRENVATNCRLAFEETMRYGAPLQHVGRTATLDVEIAGAQIRAGQRVFLLIPSANRDEREFANPDEFIWNRSMERHVAFGHGLHFCIGVHVARLEGRVLLEELLRRVPSYEIDESRSLMPPSDFQIGYTNMPILVL
jgi:cytochrome P450